MHITPTIDGVAIVLVGQFNPAIFTPAWFVRNEILSPNVETNAELRSANSTFVDFDADSIFFRITRDQFLVATTQTPHIRLCDLVLRTFREHVYHTPITALGINRQVHFQVSGLDLRRRLFSTLAPPEPWRSQLELDNAGSGMLSLTMSQCNPPNRPPGGRINVKVEPSSRIGGGRTGVYVDINDHYVSEHADIGSAGHYMKLLEDNFESSLARSAEIFGHIISLPTG